METPSLEVSVACKGEKQTTIKKLVFCISSSSNWCDVLHIIAHRKTGKVAKNNKTVSRSMRCLRCSMPAPTTIRWFSGFHLAFRPPSASSSSPKPSNCQINYYYVLLLDLASFAILKFLHRLTQKEDKQFGGLRSDGNGNEDNMRIP